MQPLSPAVPPTDSPAIAADPELKWYAAREPLVLVVLSLLAIAGFSAVAGLSRIYFRQQQFLGDRWFNRGVAALGMGKPDQAVDSFRSALRYSPNDYKYELNLAQALAASHRSEEAYSYLLNLWEREPENGTTSLELGRICASKGEMYPALRYYHNAIYAAWPDHPDDHRHVARLELIDFLLAQNATTQAQSEMIAMAANLPADSPLHLRAGDLFLQVQDYEHALEQYRDALRIDRQNSLALAGAGRAAFELGRYELAERYLEGAVTGNPQDSRSVELLHTASLVLQMDPFRRQVSASKRNRIVVAAFASAGERLKSCVDQNDDGKALSSRWNDLKAQVSERGLRENPDLVDTAMDLVFAIERQNSGECAAPNQTDQALLLIAKLHGSN